MQLTLPRPDDLHLHLRDGPALAAVAAHTAASFGRALVMPNLRPPVTTVADASAYRERILAALPEGTDFDPLMTLYLTDRTPPGEIARAAADPHVVAVKLYPAGATTNSDSGVTDLGKVDATLGAMAELGVPLCVHGEVTDHSVDVFDREAVFIDSVLGPVLDRHPDLRVVFEHLTTAEGVAFVQAAGPNVAATLTAHHLLMNRNALFAGGVRPHHWCLPVLKRERHRQALLGAVAAGHPRFFLGTDSAPHARGAKESACGCAGMYTAPHALPLYAEAFEEAGALAHLADFASRFGAAWYGLPAATGEITLVKQPWDVPEHYPFGDDVVVPLRAGEQVAWSLG